MQDEISINETVSISAECMRCHVPDGAVVPLWRLRHYHDNHELMVWHVFPSERFNYNVQSIVLAWIKEEDLGIPSHVCDNCMTWE